jgi:uncharacterized protein (TIGR02466 family)
MTSTAYFPTLIYETNLSVDNASLLSKAIELKNSDSRVTTSWFCDTFNTIGTYDITQDANFSDFVNVCMDHVKLFSHEYGIHNPIIKHKEGWINVATTNQYQEFHIHPNNHFSLAYYVSVPDNSGDIIFRSAESATDMFMLPFGAETFATMKTVKVKPVVGKLVIFRSNLLHMVEKNRSEDIRVSVSFNVILQE